MPALLSKVRTALSKYLWRRSSGFCRKGLGFPACQLLKPPKLPQDELM